MTGTAEVSPLYAVGQGHVRATYTRCGRILEFGGAAAYYRGGVLPGITHDPFSMSSSGIVETNTLALDGILRVRAAFDALEVGGRAGLGLLLILEPPYDPEARSFGSETDLYRTYVVPDVFLGPEARVWITRVVGLDFSSELRLSPMFGARTLFATIGLSLGATIRF